MKVAIFNYSSSGLFHYASCLVNALAARNDIEILFITSTHNNLALLERRDNLRVLAQDVPHRLPGFFAWLTNPTEQLRLYREVLEFKPNIIHLADSHAVYVPHQWWLAHYSILFTQHDPLIRQGDVYRWSSRLIHRTEQRLAKKIIVHGQYIKNVLVKNGIANSKIEVIPHGEYSFYRRWQKPEIQRRPHSVLFFGRVLDYKGLDTLLQSIIELQRQNIPVVLILAGAGNLSKYQKYLRLIQHKFIDNRSIPDEEVFSYFQMSTIIALPYREASQSGIAAIAMPAGVPIVATNVGALPEVLEDGVNSLLIAPNSVAELTNALEKLLTNPTLRRKLTDGAQQTVRARLLWPDIAAQYHQQYQSLL